MKSCNFNIYPRQSGKTTKLINLFLEKYKEGNKCLFICLNQQMKKRVKNIIDLEISKTPKKYSNNFKHLNITSVQELLQENFLFNDYVFIDEYMFMSEKEQQMLYLCLLNMKCHVTIYTTSFKIIDKEFFELVRFIKKHVKKYGSTSYGDTLRHMLIKDFPQMYTYLWYNFITEPLTNLNIQHENKKKMYSQEQYDTEILGKIFS